MSIKNKCSPVNSNEDERHRKAKIRLPHGIFTKVPHSLSFMEYISDGAFTLSDGAKETWKVIRSFQDAAGNTPCFASYRTLAQLRGKKRGAIIRQVNELVGAGFLMREHRTTGHGDNNTNLFRAIIPEGLSNLLSNRVSNLLSNLLSNRGGVVPKTELGGTEFETTGVPKTELGGGSENGTQNQIPIYETDDTESHASLTDGGVRESVDDWERLIESQQAKIAEDYEPFWQYVIEHLDTWYRESPDFKTQFMDSLFLPEELELCVSDLLCKQKTTVLDLSRSFKSWLTIKLKQAFENDYR